MNSTISNNDSLIRQLINHTLISQTLLVAHDIGLFEVIGYKKSIVSISETLSLLYRSAQAILSVCISVKLIIKEDDLYSLTSYANDYLLEDGTYYFGAGFDLLIRQEEVRSISAIKKAILQGRPQVYAGQDLFEKHCADPTLLKTFTKAMHAKSKEPAKAWVNKFSFNSYKNSIRYWGRRRYSCHLCLSTKG